MNFYMTLIVAFIACICISFLSTSNIFVNFFFTKNMQEQLTPDLFFINVDFYTEKIKVFVISGQDFAQYLYDILEITLKHWAIILQILYIIIVYGLVVWFFFRKLIEKRNVHISNIPQIDAVDQAKIKKATVAIQNVLKIVSIQLALLFLFHIFSKFTLKIITSGLCMMYKSDKEFTLRFHNFVNFGISLSSYASIIFFTLHTINHINNHLTKLNYTGNKIKSYIYYNKYILALTKYWFIGIILINLQNKGYIPQSIMLFLKSIISIKIVFYIQKAFHNIRSVFEYIPKSLIKFLQYIILVNIIVAFFALTTDDFFNWNLFIRYIKYLYAFIIAKIFVKGFTRRIKVINKANEFEKFYFISLYIILLYSLCRILFINISIDSTFIDKIVTLILSINFIYFVTISCINMINQHLLQKYPIYDKKHNKKLLSSMKAHTIGNFVTILIKTTSIILSIFSAMFIFDIQTSFALSGLGVIFLGISLAMQDFIKDLIYGVMVVIDQTIVVGDCININDKKGYVEKITLKGIVMRDVTTNTLLSMRFSSISAIENFNRGFVIHIIMITVKNDVDTDQIYDTLLETVQILSETEIHKDKIKPYIATKGIIDKNNTHKTIRYDLYIMQINIYKAMHDITVNFDKEMQKKNLEYSAFFNEYSPVMLKKIE